jgi:hypothetical protein
MRLGSFEVPYGEAWLLETAYRAFIPLTFLAMRDEEIGRQFNHPSHHMDRNELLGTLCSLFDRGELIATQEAVGDHIPSREQIEAALVPPVRQGNGGVAWGKGIEAPLCYGLSQLGAARWERMAEPNWSRYFEMQWLAEGYEELVAGSESRLGELLQNGRELWDVEVIATSVERDTVAPWEVSHWKTLPVGYRARFRCRHAYLSGRGQTPEYRRMMTNLLRWHRSIWEPSE